MSEIIKAKGQLAGLPSNGDHMVTIYAGNIDCGCFIIEKTADVIRSVFKTDHAKLLLKTGLEVRWNGVTLKLNASTLDRRALFTEKEFEDQVQAILELME